MENLRLLFQIYVKPGSALSGIMDSGGWIFAAVATIVLSIGLGMGVNSKIIETYTVSGTDRYISMIPIDDEVLRSEIDPSLLDENAEDGSIRIDGRRPFPVLGNSVFWLFSFDPSFITPLVVLVLFYFPGTILTASIVGRLGNPGVVLQRDYATFTTCGLMAWVAAHLPFVILAFVLGRSGLDGSVFLSIWLASGLYFGFLLVFALRTVFGMEYWEGALTIAISWIFYSMGVIAVQFIGPWLFSPFLIIFAILFFGGFIRGQLSGLGNSMRQKRDFKRHLHNATVNPNDADAHVQLGLIYAKRRQEDKAREHFAKAYEIDSDEIDANYELGKLARQDGELQQAIEHFSVVVEQDERYSLSEIWREIGVTYLTAGMLKEAEEALEKFVTRRAYDSEGLYHYGVLLKQKGESEKAEDFFTQAIDAVKTAPYYRKKELSKWARLAAKEMGN